MADQRFPDSMLVSMARERFFELSGIPPDGGEKDRWVLLTRKPFPIGFPNTRSRMRAVKLHDVHHIATEYQTDYAGESEIAAWEIASGCGRYAWAWLLNFGGLMLGLVLYYRRTRAAWNRGCHARNLYHSHLTQSEIDALTVGELRALLEPRERLT